MTATAPSFPKVLKARTPGLALDEAIPRYWFGGNAVATHIANGVNLLFPAGERFFVRSVNHYLDQLEDPALRAQVRGFFGQEGRHAKEHERVFRLLEEQGYDLAPFLRFYEHLAFSVLEPGLSPALRLATTAACEHFTAIMAENALTHRILDAAHPEMRALLLWHASEEIEHRAVAFDVLRAVAPGYPVRVAGLALATLALGGFWLLGTGALLRQEKGLAPGELRAQWAVARQARKRQRVFFRGIREYLRPGFHPSQSDIDHLAGTYLASVGLS